MQINGTCKYKILNHDHQREDDGEYKAEMCGSSKYMKTKRAYGDDVRIAPGDLVFAGEVIGNGLE